MHKSELAKLASQNKRLEISNVHKDDIISYLKTELHDLKSALTGNEMSKGDIAFRLVQLNKEIDELKKENEEILEIDEKKDRQIDEIETLAGFLERNVMRVVDAEQAV